MKILVSLMENNARQLSKLIQRNFMQYAILPVKYLSGADYIQNGGLLSVNTGYASGALNINVPIADNPSDEAFYNMLGRFTAVNRPAVIWLWDNLVNWRSYLKNQPVNMLVVNEGMCAAVQNFKISLATIPGFMIRSVNSPEDFIDFGMVVTRAFGRDTELETTMACYSDLAHTGYIKNSDLKLYLGYLHNRPVCTGASLDSSGSAGIYNIATLPDKRKLGLGSAMFHYILNDISNRRSDFCTLKASPAGRNIYAAAGFKTVCKVEIYDNRSKTT